ncbi:hypothetical protein AEAC466_08305 [Asticcacaulis sp. AC466]|uniref:hypothetical protein n=1 Tax=Asticcacaulis sp. AC466 TaxID=1282362 RepID=UPI0003C3F3EC|nr:hypothetical protein [Asticcacaulis sp. AC466]ESQ84346.1 hypothetical protein AEAC466_08305 [Asticcacaulis sp. AC466]
MRVLTFVTLYLCLAACAPAISTGAAASTPAAAARSLAATATVLPKKFVGHWDADLAACKAISDMKLTVTQTQLIFWESSGTITGVIVHAPNDVTVNAAFSGEGEQWNRVLHLVLNGDGQGLTIDGTKRVRCP